MDIKGGTIDDLESQEESHNFLHSPFNNNWNSNYQNYQNSKNDFLIWYKTDFEDPLRIPIITKLHKKTKYNNKSKPIIRNFKNILEKRNSKMEKKNLKSIYNFIKNKIKLNTEIELYFNNKTTQYGYSQKYLNSKIGKLQKVGSRNKLFLKSKEKYISILESFNSINNPIPLRSLRKGSKIIEIWDHSFKINSWVEYFIQNQNQIHSSISIYKYSDSNKKIFISRGKFEHHNQIPIKIMSLNSGGLGKNNKTETLESFLLEQNIDIALIQETKLKKSIYLRSYKSINKKAYGSDSSKGGLSIIFKPYLKFFISEKLISNEDFMGINLFDLHIINCYGRHYDTKTKINYQKKFQEKLKKIEPTIKKSKNY
ncbi:ap endonuclease [Anaeramoeba flamelloides]|uniref:Ap endonuclease n=1 Tax=Anaeramoeba flamelloides TaxID=1746091 RepID=A0AAV7ZZA1_9EUKA|nr:ap endonuclease [Anaeramoeba flamelloides]